MTPVPGAGEVPALPGDRDGPVFREPWEAQVFAIAVRLQERGLFTWLEWSEILAAEIKAAEAGGESGEAYYRHWLKALERITMQKALVSPDELAARRQAWDRAARATPHGQPILLDRGAQDSGS